MCSHLFFVFSSCYRILYQGNAIAMFSRNLDNSSLRLTKGTKLALLNIARYTLLTVRNRDDHEIHYLPRITLIGLCRPSWNSYYTYVLNSLLWCVTRLQHTGPRVKRWTPFCWIYDLIFSHIHGCFYVALSRVRSARYLTTFTSPSPQRTHQDGRSRT